MNNIVEATFVSVWDGDTAIETSCKVNLQTKEVFDIETVDVEGIDCLDKQYIEIDGNQYPVHSDDEAIEGDFWYDG